MESAMNFHTAKALLEWQVELGVTEAISDTPVNRYDVPEKAAKPVAKPAEVAPQPGAAVDEIDPVAVARQMAGQAQDLAQLKEAIGHFEHCSLRNGARNLVFSDGNPKARVMIIGEAPGRDEDREGRPFVGRAGQLLDKMLASIDLDRNSQAAADSVYITNVLPWRPPQNRDPRPEEIFMLMPFVQRHVALVDPDIVVLMGNIACHGVLGKRGITRLRGQWVQAMARPVLPMFHPAFLLRSPHMKRETWADLIELKARLLQEA